MYVLKRVFKSPDWFIAWILEQWCRLLDGGDSLMIQCGDGGD